MQPSPHSKRLQVSNVGITTYTEKPIAYFSPFPLFVPMFNFTKQGPRRPKPILIPQRTGPVPILPRGSVGSVQRTTLLPNADAAKDPVTTTKPQAQKRPFLNDNLIQRNTGTTFQQQDKKVKTDQDAPSFPSELYSKVAGITQHPSPVLLPNPDNTFVLPVISDDSVAQKYPIETVQTIDVVMEDHAHKGNQMFHSLIGSYRSIYRSCSKARKRDLTRNLAAFLRLQGVRLLVLQRGRYYECGSQRLELKIKELLSLWEA